MPPVEKSPRRVALEQAIDFVYVLLATVCFIEMLAQLAWGNDFNVVLDRPVIFGAAVSTGFLSWALDRRAP